jgi:hypothetical protein
MQHLSDFVPGLIQLERVRRAKIAHAQKLAG